MTADEIKEYINQIAFSGANEFLEKYKDKMDKDNEIIGHFGLGFYSCFMVADKVQIDTLSWQPDAEAARWCCNGGIEYEMSAGERTTRGTTITLFINEENEEFLEEFNLRKTLTKYCSFLPVEIFLNAPQEDDENKKDQNESIDESTNEDDVIDLDEDGEPITETESKKAPTPINDTNPLWLKPPNECTDEDYKSFYQKVFMDFNEPLFWIHLNMDYPFRLKGILYFPKLKHELEYIEGQVKLYNNQVFVADNIKEVIPEYLLLLKGVIDCPDLPLNVSRSFLQADATVKTMSGHISKKVADKLNGLFKKDREVYNKYWDDIAPFIKYGCIKERELYDKIKGSVLYKTISGKYKTLEEFTNEFSTGEKKTVYYVTNEQLQSQYIQMFKDQGLEAVLLHTNLDAPFISYLEQYEPDVKFNRIDADITDALKDTDATDGEQNEEQDKLNEELQTRFREILNNEKLGIKTESLKSSDISSVILLSEQSRRMQEMSKMFGGGQLPPGMFEEELTLVLNNNHSLVKKLLSIYTDDSRKDDVGLIVEHLYDLAMLSHKPLPTEQMGSFIRRSNKILELVI
jgi:molecular chaperone HtpG